MEAIEFRTILQNKTVTLPQEYANQWEGRSVRVLILEDDLQQPDTLAKSYETPQLKAIALSHSGVQI